jgi:phosphomethylpyrimidine synthase
MVANPKFLATTARVDDAAIAPLPNSHKVHIQGSRPDLRVPMREIRQSDTPASFGAERNPPVCVYDTSGPYTDPEAKIDIRRGLEPIRLPWILERRDTAVLPGPSSIYGQAAAGRCPA